MKSQKTKYYMSLFTVSMAAIVVFATVAQAEKESPLSRHIGDTVLADNFTFPQGVYNGEKVTHTKFPNGAVVNATALERIALTQPVEPYTVKITDGI